jgi:hypothetical protein
MAKFLDLSGYTFSGKHAVIDLVREFKGYHTPHFEFEFCLLRVQDGLMDLEKALVDDWSLVRCVAALRRFKRLIDILSGPPKRLSITPGGYGYETHFSGNFFRISQQYLNSLIDVSWQAEWPYAFHDLGIWEFFSRKVLKKLGKKNALFTEMALSSGEGFIEKTQKYLEDLFTQGIGEQYSTYLMYNAFEPFNPERPLRYFKDARCIIVDRDPRDNYVTGVNYSFTSSDVQSFILRHKLFREQTEKQIKSTERILKVQFEDLVLNYDTIVPTILNFLQEDEEIHIHKKRYFDPAISSQNIGIWKDYPKQDEIDLIEKELGAYCYSPERGSLW